MAENDLVRPGLCTHLKNELAEIKEKLRKKVSLLSFRELRRTKEPMYTCLEKELLEDGYIKSAIFLRNIVKKENDLHKGTEGLTILKLHNNSELLDKCLDAIKSAEAHKRNGVPSGKVYNILDVAEIFEQTSRDYEWVVEDIMLWALKESRRVNLDHGQATATVQFSLGVYYRKRKNWEKSFEMFESAMVMSNGNMWPKSRKDDANLFYAICSEFYKVLMELANQLYKKGQRQQSLQYADRALSVATNANSIIDMAWAYNLIGEMHLNCQNYEEAVRRFEKGLEYARTDGDMKLICTVELNLANCLTEKNELDESRRHVRRAIKFAQTNSYKEQLALGYFQLGHIERKNNQNTVAAENYIKAVEIYNKLGLEKKVRQARCLAAVALAQEVTPPYIETILKSDKAKFGDNPYMDKLLRWADNREVFWDDKETISVADTTFSINDEGFALDQEAVLANSCYSKSLSEVRSLMKYINLSKEEPIKIQELQTNEK